MVDKLTVVRLGMPSPPCAHYWRIEKPAGATSKGICKYCGASRDFRNYNYLLGGQTPYRARKSPKG